MACALAASGEAGIRILGVTCWGRRGCFLAVSCVLMKTSEGQRLPDPLGLMLLDLGTIRSRNVYRRNKHNHEAIEHIKITITTSS